MILPKGLGARQYGSYRITRNGEVALATTNEDEANIETLEVTASGDTQILPTPGVTEYLVIKGFHFSNDGAKVTVSLKAGAGGKEKFTTTLLANGGNFDKNLIGRYWRLPINKPLLVNLSGAGNVFVTVEYEGMDEPGPESVELTDSLVITEALVEKTEFNDALADAQALSAAVAKDVVKPALTDSMASITESNVRTGDRYIALGDSMPVTENLGNSTTTKLSEADALIITESVDVKLSPTI
jgi:hypothetical protein